MFFIIGTFMRIGMFLILLLISWRYADWKNWKEYSPTVVFMMVVHLFNSLITDDYDLWHFTKSKFFPNDVIMDLWLTFATLPLIVLIYLSRYPYKTGWIRQFSYIAGWVIVFSLVELLFKISHGISYYHGWSYFWSIVLWCITFPVFTLYHAKRRIWAWLICIVFSVFVIYHFHIPIT